MGPISIIIADSQYLIRLGLRKLLAQEAEFRILAEVTNERQLEEQLLQQQADLIILDYQQPGAFSTQSVRKIRHLAPKSNILIISADSDKNGVLQVLEQGVNSFLTKQCEQEEIINAVKASAKGEKFFCNKVLNYLLERSFPQDQEQDCRPTPLSVREIEIVRLVASGKIAKEIADELHLSTHTVYTHRKNIMKKLQLNSASELVLYAVSQGIV